MWGKAIIVKGLRFRSLSTREIDYARCRGLQIALTPIQKVFLFEECIKVIEDEYTDRR
jgi:hypothetical protein